MNDYWSPKTIHLVTQRANLEAEIRVLRHSVSTLNEELVDLRNHCELMSSEARDVRSLLSNLNAENKTLSDANLTLTSQLAIATEALTRVHVYHSTTQARFALPFYLAKVVESALAKL